MTYYGAKELASSFRTVRKNTIAIAEEIPEAQYDFRAAPGTRTVGELLAHLAVNTGWQIGVHGQGTMFIDFEMYGRNLAQTAANEQSLRTKDQIVGALRANGERFSAFVDSLDEARLAESVGFPPPVQPSSRTRFEMLQATKEPEMHHRGQLMLIQRILGIVPHLTRQREAMAAQAAAPRA